MGNCWGSSPVDHYSSNTHPTIPNSPAVVKKANSQGRDPVIRSAGSSGGVGFGRGGGGSSSGGVGIARGNSGGSANASGTPGRDNKVVNNPNKVSVVPAVGKIVTPNPKVFTFAELKSATRNFKPATVLGEGGFGRVFKGWIDEETLAPSKVGVGMAVAVKKCSADSLQGVKEWQAEVDFLGKFSHPNLVRLVGYCWEDKELLLVYEYMRKGSLESHLFSKHVDPPSWGARIKIAMDAARGLDFLHTSENTVIYRDFKAANILLDEDFNAKLSDFGLARLGPDNGKSHVTTQAVGTYGYAAPEYVATGHLYVKSDVYGFGVVLLEILTGLRAYDLNRPNGQHNLVDWYKPMLTDRTKLKKIIDPRMGEHPPEGVQKLGQLILRCLEHDPKSRPSMSDVLIILERISTLIMKPSRTKPNALPQPRSSSRAHGHGRDRERVHSRHQGINRPGNTGPLR